MSGKKLKLELSQRDFEELHVALSKVRRNSATVKVSVAAVAALLLDHGRLINLHEGRIEE